MKHSTLKFATLITGLLSLDIGLADAALDQLNASNQQAIAAFQAHAQAIQQTQTQTNQKIAGWLQQRATQASKPATPPPSPTPTATPTTANPIQQRPIATKPMPSSMPAPAPVITPTAPAVTQPVPTTVPANPTPPPVNGFPKNNGQSGNGWNYGF